MRVQLNIMLIVFTLLLTISCGRQIDCPNFDDKVLDWLPYQTNSIITLTNLENDSILSLNVNEYDEISKVKSPQRTTRAAFESLIFDCDRRKTALIRANNSRGLNGFGR